MIHNMKLWRDSFYKIADGSKTIELRLCDEKRQKIAVGDTIVFSCSGNKNIIQAQVKALHKFVDFKELYKNLPLDKCGYTAGELTTADYTDMYAYYTQEQIEKYGVLGIELCDVEAICDVKSELLNEQIYTLLTPSVFNPTTEKLRKRAKKYFDTDNTFTYVFMQDGYNVGIIVFDISDNDAIINDIAVKNEFRGMGIGGKLIQFIAKQFDANSITAETDDDAVEFYKKCGFEAKEIESEFDTNRYLCKLKKQIA